MVVLNVDARSLLTASSRDLASQMLLLLLLLNESSILFIV